MSDGNSTPGEPAAQASDPRLVEATTLAGIAEAEARASKAALESEQSKLGLENAKLQAELALAKGRGEALKELLPDPKTTALEGQVSVYGDEAKLGYAAELVAYRMLGELEVAVAERVCAEGVLIVEEPDEGQEDGERPTPVVLIVGEDPETHASGDLVLLEVEAQLKAYGAALGDHSDRNERLLQAYKASEEGEQDRVRAAFADPATLALFLGAAPRTVGAIADVASYFRADYGVKEREFDLDRRGLVAAVAGRLRVRGVDVRVSNLMDVSDSPLLGELSRLQGLAVELRASKDALSHLAAGSMVEEVARLKKRLDEAEKGVTPTQERPADAPPGQENSAGQPVTGTMRADATSTGGDGENRSGERDELERRIRVAQRSLDEAKAAVSSTETLISGFDGFCAAITAVEEARPASKLARAIVREKMRAAGITHLLWLDVLSSGGEVVTKRTLWPWSSGQVSLMGGAAIAFVLATTSGKVAAADTLTRMAVLERPLFGGERGSQVTI